MVFELLVIFINLYALIFIIFIINPSKPILINNIGVFTDLFLLRNIIIQHIKISHLQFLSDLDLTAWTQLAEVKDCWMLSLAWQTWTTVPGERIIIVIEQCEDTAILFTRPVVQVVGHLGREVEVLTSNVL